MKIINRIYENQNVGDKWPVIKHISNVCTIIFIVIDKGWFSWIKINMERTIAIMIVIVISENSLI